MNSVDSPRLQPHNLEAEQSVLGAILLDNAALSTVKELLTDKDFYRTAHCTIYRAMLDLAERGEAIDQITLTEHLRTKGELESVGGSAYLAELFLIVATAANIKYHCKIVRDDAWRRQMIAATGALAEEAYQGVDVRDLSARAAQIGERARNDDALGKSQMSLIPALLDFPTLQQLTLPPRTRHLAWLPEGGNVMVYGPRGIGKTFFQLGLTAALTTGSPFLQWPVTAPVGVLYVDGEMQLDELRTRLTQLLPIAPTATLQFLTSEWVYHTLGRDLVLTSEAVRTSVHEILDAHPEIRVVILDNVSCLFAGIDEDKKRDWEPINAWLIRLRHRGLATVLVHHSGKGGQQRGTSGREDALDTVVQLAMPVDYDPQEGCHFEFRFTKSRSVKGAEVAPLDVRLEETASGLGWRSKPLEKSKEEQVRELMDEGMTSASEIAEALGIDRSYAWKLMSRIKKGKKSQEA